VTGEVSFDAMVVAAGNAYILDSKGGRVISVPLNNSAPPATLFTEGQTYGGTPAKKPQFFAWEGNETTGRLLVLDAERKLFAIRPGSLPEPLALRRTNTWSSVAGIAAYDGNLYVLDPNGNKVHRYLTAANGFDSEPESILSGQVDLKDAIQLAVDGDIFVLKRTGEVLRFSQGASAKFALDGIDRELTGPNAMQVVAPTSEVYIADAGNKRVVVAGKDGVFRRQLVSSAFTDVRALGIDPLGGQLYVIVGDALLTAPIVR
jgi:sugar lactone lactonase YvrE